MCYKTLFPNYSLPTSKTVVKMGRAFFTKCVDKTKAALSARIGEIALTMDLVTLPKTSKSYLVSTGHFITNDFRVEAFSLGCIRMKEVKPNIIIYSPALTLDTYNFV